jgi:iron complex outermembrane receptor protein
MSLEEILSAKKDIRLIRRGAYAQEPIVRMYKDGAINLTIDGMRVFSACTDRMDPASSYLEVSNIASVEAEGTAQGGGYGGGLGMHTYTPDFANEASWKTQISSGIQTNALAYNFGYASEFSDTKRSARLTFNWRDHQNYRAGGSNEVVPFSHFKKLNLFAGGEHKLGKAHTLGFRTIYDLALDVGYPALPMDVSKAEGIVTGLFHRYTWTSSILKDLETRIYYTAIHHEMTDEFRPEVELPMDMPGLSRSLGLRSKLHLRHVRHHLNLLLEAYTYRQLAEMTMYPTGSDPMYMMTWPDIGRVVAALSIQDKWELNENQILEWAWRIDIMNSEFRDPLGKMHTEVFYPNVFQDTTQLVNNIHLKWTAHFIKGRFIQFKVGFGERFPTVSEQFGFYLFNARDGYDLIGNPYLSPEKNLQWQFTIGSGQNEWGWETEIYYHHLLSYYQEVIDPELSPMTLGALGVKRVENWQHGHLLGASGSGWVQLAHDWRIQEYIGLMYGIRSNGSPLPNIYPFNSQLTIEKGLSSWKLRANWEFSGRQDRNDHWSGELETASFHLLHIGFVRQWTFSKSHLSLSLDLNNVFDVRYRRHYDWNDIPQPGRNLRVGILLTI